MKALSCEMCGGTNVVKQDGVFVCQSCGTKYSVEEAKKMMVEGTVDVQGTVKVDTSDELKNLYEIARRAKDSDNSENAAKYYDMVLVKDPSSWEANFFVVYYSAMNCTIGQIASAATSVSNCLPSVLDLVNSSVSETNRGTVLSEIKLRCSSLAHMLSGAANQSFYNLDLQDFKEDIFSSAIIVHLFAELLEEKYQGKYGTMSAELWKDSIEILQIYTGHFMAGNHLDDIQELLDEYGEKIKKYDSSYVTPIVNRDPNIESKVQYAETNSSSEIKKSGCYIATSVYGSYDCPEVWTLRRFRDFTLDESLFGRLFIKSYYIISPTLVKWFGNTNWFKALWKPVLDSMVKKLQNIGVKSTPYKDKY